MIIDPLVAELHSRRRDAGLSQCDLAEVMGTTQSHVSEAETGLSDPRLSILRRWGAALGVQPGWIPVAYETAPAADLPAGSGGTS